ncbi:diguanylate cyclase (plasmid) [Deinococcus proteolyticus MRP]|uniref:Diguanylate cyclase n=1 Tax=Deinococcus proteolyticus (strain ATCC 35074 / DSM 20540 / JCM 6276 / NBRC 101906 / NCIMB 13154 / VKM Ac-1939 / CCM 2703 / MRP) TaxID=693977 RepID=F0RQT3_DEIPM|nr:GGDEF domain-containing protein [Deinococcus proteolyticus]ADY27642.1 diguanylate cyclase [Deinococcus proteolyticus MRP]
MLPSAPTEQQIRQRFTLLGLLSAAIHLVGFGNTWLPDRAMQQAVCGLGLTISLTVLYLVRRSPMNLGLVRARALALAVIWLLASVVPPGLSHTGGASTDPHLLSLMNLALLGYALLPGRLAGWVSAGAYLVFLVSIFYFHGVHQLPYLSAGITLLLLHYVGSHSYELLNVRQRAQHLAHLAAYDHLTGLLNRYGMEEKLRELWDRVQSHGNGDDATLLLLDIDHFKAINDQHGHDVGDRVLRRVSRALTEACPEGQVGRWGGEEFLVVLPPISPSEAKLLPSRLTACLAATGRAIPGGQPVTLSGGGVQFSEADSLPQLIALADQRLYAAKRLGRDRVEWSSAANPQTPLPETAL